MKDLSIILPAYNEVNRIGKTLTEFSQYLERTAYNYELIVVDDGSTDGTAELVKRMQVNIPHLRVKRCMTNKGKGQAVRVGMLSATGKICLFSDADGATPIEELEKILTPIQSGEVEISIGSRYLKDSKITKAQPLYRRVWSRTANRIVQRILLPGILDPHCGFKAFSAKSAKTLFGQATVNEWSFDLEILALAKKYGFGIQEVAVEWIHDEASKGKISQLPQEIKNLLVIRKRILNTN